MTVATPPAPASSVARPAAVPATAACKLCLVGRPGVGKTSLVQRLVYGRFPALPTGPGITVAPHRWNANVAAALWDVAGNSAIDTLNQAFLSRVQGIAAVAAADDRDSVALALALVARIRALYPDTPASLLLNRADRAAPPALPDLPADIPWHAVSALDGSGVDAAFAELAARAARVAPVSR
jgi:hypothetical protein